MSEAQYNLRKKEIELRRKVQLTKFTYDSICDKVEDVMLDKRLAYEAYDKAFRRMLKFRESGGAA
jgi:hypothetical protein